jgi:histidine triad (HIT) family protein
MKLWSKKDPNMIMNRATTLLAKALRVPSRTCTKPRTSLFKTAASCTTAKLRSQNANPLLQHRGLAYRPKNIANPLEMKQEYDEIMEEQRREADIELPDKHDPKPEMLLQYPQDTIFAKIVAKQIPATIIFEDEKVLCFQDINPAAPHHYLIIPKKPIAGIDQLERVDAELVGHCLVTAKKVAADLGFAETGYRIVTNIGRDGQQSVRWLHFHLMGGRRMTWPPG